MMNQAGPNMKYFGQVLSFCKFFISPGRAQSFKTDTKKWGFIPKVHQKPKEMLQNLLAVLPGRPAPRAPGGSAGFPAKERRENQQNLQKISLHRKEIHEFRKLC